MNGWDSDRFHEPGCADSECRGCKPPNPTREALAQLARQLDEIAAATDEWSPASLGYKLAMRHAAERAWNAANDHNEPEDPEAWWQQHLAAASQRADGHQD